MPTVALSGYLQAVLRARARLLALDVEAVRGLVSATDAYARDLERALARLARDDFTGQRFLRAALQANKRLGLDLQRALTRITQKNVELSYAEVSKLLQRAASRALGASAAATLGITSIAPLEAAAAYLARRGTAATFTTLTAQATMLGTGEVDRIIASAIGTGADPMALSRRLRSYVQGSEDLQDLARDGIIKLPDIPKSMRGAGRLMEFNARRIALTEMGNAAHEAEVREFSLTPHVRAVKWMLAPNRGTQTKPDACDILAKTDYYGMGPGVYPVGKVPAKPHPFCRCWLLPVQASSVGELDERKPNPERTTATKDSPVLEGLPPAERKRLIANANEKVRGYVGPGGVPKASLVAKSAAPVVPVPEFVAPAPFVPEPVHRSVDSLAAGIGQTAAFTPARSLEEAARFATETLGIRSNYATLQSSRLVSEQMLTENANYLNEGLLRLKRLDLPMPTTARLEAGSAKGAMAWYTPREKAVTLNVRSKVFSKGPTSVRAAEARAAWTKEGAIASDHPFGILYHEYAHHLDNINPNTAVAHISRAPLPTWVRGRLWSKRLIGPSTELIEQDVAWTTNGVVEAWRQAVERGGMSHYGMTMKCEFIAETASRVMARQFVDPVIIETYFEIGGPEIPGILEKARGLIGA